jgi:hypothetical protein
VPLGSRRGSPGWRERSCDRVFGFSASPTCRELFDIHAICQWCVAGAVQMTLLAALCLTRTLRAPGPG